MLRLKKTTVLFGLLVLFHTILGSVVYPQEEEKQRQEKLQEPRKLPLASLVHLKGIVEIKADEKADWQEALASMELEPNNILKTEIESYVMITFFDGSKVRVEENTIVTIKKLHAALNEKGEFEQGNIGISVILGEVTTKIEKIKMKERVFEIESPSSLIGVRGTFFTVKVDRAKKTHVMVLRGKVSVKNVQVKTLQKVKEVMVGNGQGIEVERGEFPSKMRKLSNQEISKLEKREDQMKRDEEQTVFKW